MPELVEFRLADGSTVLVQAESGDDGAQGPVMRGFRDRAGSGSGSGTVVRQAERGFEQAVNAVRPAAEALVEQLRTLAGGPQEVSIEFGLQMSAHAGAFIAQAATAANFTVKVKWRRPASPPTAGAGAGDPA